LDVNEYVNSLVASAALGPQVAHHRVLSAQPACSAGVKKKWPAGMAAILAQVGVKALYAHQSQAIDKARAGDNVVVATPTASGKSLIYHLPVIESILNDPKSSALYLFPLKALAQDQFKAFAQMVARCAPHRPRAAIYDGDTSQWQRKKIRNAPPHVLITNPDMLHLSILPYHHNWADFLAGLRFLIIDEVHTYRGVMGTHMAQVFRRLRRVCAAYGADPVFILSSATVSNPGQLAKRLTGLDFHTICQSGAPQGNRHMVFIDPVQSASTTAILLLKAALHRGLRTIVYTKSRKMTELIALWAGSRSGKYKGRIKAYRAGLLPEERRWIEARLAAGELLAVISTSALELGIDIGDLDLCLLVGYPGSIVATWQRVGRVGRAGQDSAAILIAGQDALDQYFMRHPEDFFQRQPESAVIDPHNTAILEKQLVCAAADLALTEGEPYISDTPVKQIVSRLARTGQLIRSHDGAQLFARAKYPQRDVDLRGTGDSYAIVSIRSGRNKGDIDAFRAFKETHPGAVYLHQGETFLVQHLDIATKTVKVARANVNFYTRFRSRKETEILEIHEQKQVCNTAIGLGRLKVTEQVTGYEKWSAHGNRKLNIIDLDLPPLVFETEGIWLKIPPAAQQRTEAENLHFMGGIHALEHAAIGMFPLLVMTDRNDLGGISIPLHPQIGCAAVFVYDAASGGAGLCGQAFARAHDLLTHTFKAIGSCPCETGCPSCVHSPKCGSGNRPIDKAAALFILDQIIDSRDQGLPDFPEIALLPPPSDAPVVIKPATQPASTSGPYAVFDLETQRSFQEVGGWRHADRMGISCAVLYDSEQDDYFEYLESDIPEFIQHLTSLPLVVGFNIKRFDYVVLKGYSDYDFTTINSLDILEQIYNRLNYRLSLNNLATVTLGAEKSADGLLALKWWTQGKIKKIVKYCAQDVQLTRDLFLFGRQNNYLLYQNKAGNKVRVPVAW